MSTIFTCWNCRRPWPEMPPKLTLQAGEAWESLDVVGVGVDLRTLVHVERNRFTLIAARQGGLYLELRLRNIEDATTLSMIRDVPTEAAVLTAELSGLPDCPARLELQYRSENHAQVLLWPVSGIDVSDLMAMLS